MVLSAEQGDGGGVGHPVGKDRLVDVESDAADGGGDVVALQGAGDKGAADFVTVDENVVGPFDVDVVLGQQLHQQVADAQRHYLRDAEGVVSPQKGGFQYDADGEVSTGLALPPVATLSDAGALTMCPNNGKLLNLAEVEEFTVLVGRC